jgi:EAL and modified HD-GYP domain-containing signal transduction protein
MNPAFNVAGADPGVGGAPVPSILMARQPLFDVDANVAAYELLFRDSEENRASFIDGDSATSEVLINAFTQLDFDGLVGNKRAYINFTRNLLVEPPPFDRSRYVIEVLEDINIDDRFIADLTTLHKAGYTIALDDFVIRETSHQILPLADIVKIDVLTLNPTELRDHLEQLPRTTSLCSRSKLRPTRSTTRAVNTVSSCSRGTSCADPS